MDVGGVRRPSVVLKEEDKEVMEKGRIGALLSSVDAGRKLWCMIQIGGIN